MSVYLFRVPDVLDGRSSSLQTSHEYIPCQLVRNSVHLIERKNVRCMPPREMTRLETAGFILNVLLAVLQH